MQEILRHEEKYLITAEQYNQLRQLGRQKLTLDPYTNDGIYWVRSLYFDTRMRKDYRDSMEHREIRHKLRLRTYGDDGTFYRLEEKFKKHGLSGKRSVEVTHAQAQQIAAGDYTCLQNLDGYGPRLYQILIKDGYLPALTVNYWRDVFILPGTDFRMTLDWDAAYADPRYFWRPEESPLPDAQSPMLLEVKYSDTLPGWLVEELIKIGVVQENNSKYCRGMAVVYGM